MSNTAAKRSRGARVLGLGFAALFVLLCIAALIVYLGWHSKPAHWDKEQSRLAGVPDTQRQAISASLRNRLLKQWSDPGEKTPVTEADLFGHRRVIEIPYDELNTWIQTEGLDLLAEIDVEVPDSATTAMIDSPGGGLLRISFEVAADNVQQVIALSFAVRIAEDGTLTSTLKQATAGRLPLPVEAAIDMVASQADDGILLDLMQGKAVEPIELPIDASDTGRDGRLVGLEVTDEALIITRETVRRKRAD
ncbi:MAG: hypothetical protein KTR15_00345 [Phycisphaeraceae bacterium]|nr:hypothetical protein [Phycisphaeraceae bacterium]